MPTYTGNLHIDDEKYQMTADVTMRGLASPAEALNSISAVLATTIMSNEAVITVTITQELWERAGYAGGEGMVGKVIESIG